MCKWVSPKLSQVNQGQNVRLQNQGFLSAALCSIQNTVYFLRENMSVVPLSFLPCLVKLFKACLDGSGNLTLKSPIIAIDCIEFSSHSYKFQRDTKFSEKFNSNIF